MGSAALAGFYNSKVSNDHKTFSRGWTIAYHFLRRRRRSLSHHGTRVPTRVTAHKRLLFFLGRLRMASRSRLGMGMWRTGMVVDGCAVRRESMARKRPRKSKLRGSRRRRSTTIQWRQSTRHRGRPMGVMGTPGERGRLGEHGRRLRGMLLILIIGRIEGMALIRRGVDAEMGLVSRRLGIVRRSPRHDGRVYRPRGGESLSTATAKRAGYDGRARMDRASRRALITHEQFERLAI